MPWVNPSLEPLISEIKLIINHQFSEIIITASVLIASKSELIEECLSELRTKGFGKREISKAMVQFQYLHGKYFRNRNEIWLVENEGENLDVILHEFLHSIQICSPNREGITDYITFKLTNNRYWIDDYTLENWVEIERNEGFDAIKDKLLSEGDCEEF